MSNKKPTRPADCQVTYGGRFSQRMPAREAAALARRFRKAGARDAIVILTLS
jgi:hypothetical protein